MRKFKFVGLLVAIFSFANLSFACGWSEDWESDFYRFFDPEYADLTALKPFNFTFDRLYDYDLLEPNHSSDPNLDEWQKYLGNSISRVEIEALVYGVSEDLLINLKKSNFENNPTIGNNSLVKLWKTGKRLEIFDYLLFAHEAEKYCTAQDPWDENPVELGDSREVADRGVAKAASAKDPFLKLRYAYQATRLYQYNYNFPEAENTFLQYAEPNLSASPTIGQWARSNYAGTLRNLDREADAAYQFSRVFTECPSRRIQAWYSWRIHSDEIWEEALSKCKNNKEMATMFFLRGFSPNAISFEDMRQMYELDPESKMLEVLLMREINKLELQSLGYPFQARKSLGKRLIENNHVAQELLSFTNEVLRTGKMHDKNIWNLAHVYLRFLNGDMQAASKELEEVQPKLTGEGILKGRLLDLVFRIAMTQKVDRSVENTILKDYVNLSKDLKESEAKKLEKFRDETFAWVYDSQGEIGKAYLARHNEWQLTDYQTSVDLINDLLAFEEKADKTLYEKMLLDRLHHSFSHEAILEIKGTRLLSKNLVPEAIKVFEQLPASYQSQSSTFNLQADPFMTRTRDVVNCEMDCGEGIFNKLSYAKRILELQKMALTDPENSAQAYLLLGNAEYNTTYFGPAFRAKDYYRSGGSWYSLGEHSEWFNFNISTFDENVDCSLAKDYYTKAMLGFKDKEKAARAAFMVAKCELNQFYCDGSDSMAGYQNGFKTLREKYRRTAFYDQIISECWYFAAYANNQ